MIECYKNYQKNRQAGIRTRIHTYRFIKKDCPHCEGIGQEAFKMRQSVLCIGKHSQDIRTTPSLRTHNRWL